MKTLHNGIGPSKTLISKRNNVGDQCQIPMLNILNDKNTNTRLMTEQYSVDSHHHHGYNYTSLPHKIYSTCTQEYNRLVSA